MPFPVIVEDPKLFEPFSVRVPAPFMNNDPAVTLEAKVEEFAAVIASALLIERELLTISDPAPLLVKELAAMLEPVRFTVPVVLFTVMLLAVRSAVTVIRPPVAFVPKVTLSPVENAYCGAPVALVAQSTEVVSQVPAAFVAQKRFSEPSEEMFRTPLVSAKVQRVLSAVLV